MDNQRLNRISSVLIIAALITAFLVVAADFLIPIAWAFLFSFVMHPVCVYLERKNFSRTFSTTIAVVIFLLVGGGLMYILVYEATVIVTSDNLLYDRLSDLILRIKGYANTHLGIDLSQPDDKATSSAKFRNVVITAATALRAIGENLITMTLIPMYLFFILNYRALFRKFIENKYSEGRLDYLRNFIRSAQISIENYLIGTLILTLVTAVMTFIVLILFGVDYAIFFSIFMAVLNLIPYIGNIIAFVFILFYVYISKESISTAALIGGILYASNMIQENFLRPILVGNKMEMNAMVVFTGVIIGGVLWGVSGMVLFIPLMGVIKSMLIHDEKMRPFAIFFEEVKVDKPSKVPAQPIDVAP